MNAPFSQAERLGRLTTNLGPDVLSLLRFDGTDHLNDLFEYRVEALATRDDLDFDALIGTHATVEVEAHDQMQPFDGIVTSARWAGVGENGHRYDLTLRPWFWLAGRRRNQRIFHNQTVVQILQELLSDYASLGDPALEIVLSKDYPTLEYTVQYRESDLDFARRQMERAGISFHFKHAMGSHTLVLTDDVLAHDSIGARPFKSYDGHHQYEQEHFWDWAPERNITTGAIRLTDYNFKKPTAAMEADRRGDARHAQGQIESFDYPGDYPAQDVGRLVAGLRTEQERGADRRNRAVGDCASLSAGMRMTLSGDKVPGTGETYLCLSASHHFVSEAYGSGGAGSDGYAFTGSYVLMPDTAPMAPPKRTLAAVVQGPQTATVVGEGEIDCDEYGRILVRFHWDLQNAYSMRCRVSQNWAGAGWGGMVIPRIGMEVLVEFLEGDPDKPVVVGNVYNGKNDVPYPLPAHKTRSTFRTDTHQGEGFNEVRFEDKAGLEEIMTHAQRDMNTVVRRDWLLNVGRSSFNDVAVHHFERAGGNYVREAKGTVEISAGRGMLISAGNMNVSGEQFSHIPICEEPNFQNDKFSLARMNSASSNGGIVLSAETIMMEQVGLSKNTVIGAAAQELVGMDKTMMVGKTFRVGAGKTVSLAAADNVTIEAGDRIDIVCGNSAIRMTADGVITISGTHIKLEADRIDEN